jgi:polyisoprenoid-binding protein YceI
MRNRIALCTLSLLALVAAPGVQAQNAATMTIGGTSTVRSWKCTVPHTLEALPAGAADAVLTGERAVQTLTLQVDVAAIDCGNGKMNEHLRNALKAKDHPAIQYQLTSYDLARAGDGTQASVRGTLTIAGSTQPIAMQIALAKDDAGALRATGEQQITMSQYGVKPPSLMMGTMKVGDVVRVTFDVIVGPQSAGNGAGDSTTFRQRN